MLLMSNSFGLSSNMRKLLKPLLVFSALVSLTPFLVTSAPADRIIRASTKATTGLLLDITGGTKAAVYSLRRLTTTYAGSAVNIRRASDNATLDIGFTVSNELDLATFNTFCASTTCFVDDWYDQSGNGNDAVQVTAANQPQIFASVVALNGQPGILSVVDTANALSAPASASLNNMFVVNGLSVMVISFVGITAGFDRPWDRGGTINYRDITGAGNNFGLFQQATANGSWMVNPAVTTGSHIIDVNYSNALASSTPSINYDAVPQGLTSVPYVGTPASDVGTPLGLFGSPVAARGFPGYEVELLFYKDSVPSGADLNIIRANEKVYYGTP